MKDFFKKPFVYATVFAVTLTSLNAYVLLKTFLIPSVQTVVSETAETSEQSPLERIDNGEDNQEHSRMERHKPGTDSADGSGRSSRRTRPSGGKKSKGSRNGSSSSDSSGSSDSSKGKTQNSDNTQTNDNAQSNETIQKTLTDTSYSDGKISVQINTVRSNDTTVYIADVQLSSAAYLKTALAQNAFGRNVTEKTSAIASDHNAILAINGDYYGANSQGYVIKNGVLYRDTVRKSSDSEDLVIYRDGSFGIINEKDVTAQQLLDSGVYNLLSFGPALVQNGKVTVSENDEVGRAMADNPRTAIGIIDDLHYILVVSDGRTNESEGLSLYQLAQLMQQYGCKTAYNLDGGGSSTMVFNGQVVNNPTTNGNRISERAVSDIVYIGY